MTIKGKGIHEVNGIRRSTVYKYYELEFYNGSILKCTIDHIFESIDGPITAKFLQKDSQEVLCEEGSTFLKNKKYVRRKMYVYDLVDVSDGSLYYTNGILSHNCSFLGSSNTLISGHKLQELVHLDPISFVKDIKVYAQPDQSGIYVATVDVCGGKSQDYSVISVFDVTTSPYRQVCVYRSNTIDPTSLAGIAANLGMKYNEAYIIVESNNDGKLTAKELWDLEYENIICTRTDNGENSIRRGRKSSPGIMTTKKTKRIGCAKLKDLIENGVLEIYNDDTISELNTFIQKGSSYEADDRKNDDCVMTLVIFAWFCSTIFFEDISGNNTRNIVNASKEEDMSTIFGVINGAFSNNEESDTFDFGFYKNN